MIAPNRQQRDRQLFFEMAGIELHVLDDVAAVVEGSVHPPFAGVGMDIGCHVVRRDRIRLEDFVLEPPPDIDLLFSLGELRGQIGKHLEDEIPLPLVVGEFDVVGQGDARYAGVDQRKRLEVLRKLQRPAVGAPRAEIVRHHKQRCAKSIHERMKHLGHLVSMADPIEGDLFRFGPCIER